MKAPKPWPATRAAVEAELGEHRRLGALGRALVDAGAGDRAGELGAEHAVVGVGRAGEVECTRGAGADLVGELGDLGRGLLRLHPDRLGADQAGLGAGLDQLLGDGQVDRLEVEELLERGDQRREVDLLLVGDLLEQVVAADQVLGAVVAERARRPP